MLLCTRGHFIKSLTNMLAGQEGPGSDDERKQLGQDMRQRIEDYASDESGLQPGCEVWNWEGSRSAMEEDTEEEAGHFHRMVAGKQPRPGQRVVYVDGGFDLFSSGHIEFLRRVVQAEEDIGHQQGWYSESARQQRVASSGEDYGPAYVVAGVHDDEVINRWKGVNYPIMNIFERGLCVLQCRYVHAMVFSAPFTPTKSYLSSLPPLGAAPAAVYHGPTSFMPLTYDPYTAPKAMGVYREIGEHDFSAVNAGEIVQRIMKSRAMYEERQRAKAAKAGREEEVRMQEASKGENV